MNVRRALVQPKTQFYWPALDLYYGIRHFRRKATKGVLFMSLRSTKRHVCGLAACAFVLVFLACPASAQRGGEASPFAQMAGAWSGSGSVNMANGTKERIRCRSTYQVDSAAVNMQIDLRCASDSYKFELRSNVSYNDGEIRGTWDELSRSVGGHVTGRASSGQIQATAAGQTFTAILNLATRGNSQTISIRSPGSELSEAVITLSKGSR